MAESRYSSRETCCPGHDPGRYTAHNSYNYFLAIVQVQAKPDDLMAMAVDVTQVVKGEGVPDPDCNPAALSRSRVKSEG